MKQCFSFFPIFQVENVISIIPYHKRNLRQRGVGGKVLVFCILNFRNHSFHEVVQLQIRHTAGIFVKWELFLSRHFTRGRKSGRFFLTSSFPSRVYKPLDVSCLNIWFNFYKLWNKGSPINNSPIWGMSFSKLKRKSFHIRTSIIK